MVEEPWVVEEPRVVEEPWVVEEPRVVEEPWEVEEPRRRTLHCRGTFCNGSSISEVVVL